MVQKILTTEQIADNEIKRLVKEIRKRRNMAEYHERKADAVRDQLETLLKAKGANWSDAVGYARLIPPSERISFDHKSLDELILRDPAFDCLRAYRKVSPIRASIQVK